MGGPVHYTYANSSAAYRTRIALNYKGVAAEERYVHLLKAGGEQHGAAYAGVNPQEVVPSLVVGGQAIGQSLAIIEYLEETCPEPPLLPRDPLARARVRQIALAIACDIHPLNNLRVRQYLAGTIEADEATVAAWMRHWIGLGFAAVERLLDGEGPYACGPVPTMADVVLVPQVFNARRIGMELHAWPRIARSEAAARGLAEFAAAAPDRQPDFDA